MTTEVFIVVDGEPWVLSMARVPVEGELLEWRGRFFQVCAVLWTGESFSYRPWLDLQEASRLKEFE